jgi:DNA-binding CsgD family transcriptional regulator
MADLDGRGDPNGAGARKRERTARLSALVIKLTSEGMSNTEIAARLGIDMRTVQRYRRGNG